MQSQNRKTLTQIRNEIRAAVIGSCEIVEQSEGQNEELLISDNSVFGDVVENIGGKKITYRQEKEDIIGNLGYLYEYLRDKKVDAVLFPQITTYFSNLDNLGATYSNRDENINDSQIRKVFLVELRKSIELVENKYGFALIQELPDFDEFLSTGVAEQKVDKKSVSKGSTQTPVQQPEAAPTNNTGVYIAPEILEELFPTPSSQKKLPSQSGDAKSTSTSSNASSLYPQLSRLNERGASGGTVLPPLPSAPMREPSDSANVAPSPLSASNNANVIPSKGYQSPFGQLPVTRAFVISYKDDCYGNHYGSRVFVIEVSGKEQALQLLQRKIGAVGLSDLDYVANDPDSILLTIRENVRRSGYYDGQGDEITTKLSNRYMDFDPDAIEHRSKYNDPNESSNAQYIYKRIINVGRGVSDEHRCNVTDIINEIYNSLRESDKGVRQGSSQKTGEPRLERQRFHQPEANASSSRSDPDNRPIRPLQPSLSYTLPLDPIENPGSQKKNDQDQKRFQRYLQKYDSLNTKYSTSREHSQYAGGPIKKASVVHYSDDRGSREFVIEFNGDEDCMKFLRERIGGTFYHNAHGIRSTIRENTLRSGYYKGQSDEITKKLSKRYTDFDPRALEYRENCIHSDLSSNNKYIYKKKINVGDKSDKYRCDVTDIMNEIFYDLKGFERGSRSSSSIEPGLVKEPVRQVQQPSSQIMVSENISSQRFPIIQQAANSSQPAQTIIIAKNAFIINNNRYESASANAGRLPSECIKLESSRSSGPITSAGVMYYRNVGGLKKLIIGIEGDSLAVQFLQNRIGNAIDFIDKHNKIDNIEDIGVARVTILENPERNGYYIGQTDAMTKKLFERFFEQYIRSNKEFEHKKNLIIVPVAKINGKYTYELTDVMNEVYNSLREQERVSVFSSRR